MDDLILIRRIDKNIKIVNMTNRLLSEMGRCSNSGHDKRVFKLSVLEVHVSYGKHWKE